MIVPDVNLLLYAEIDAFPQHPDAKVWWERALNGSRLVGLPPVSVFGFLRIATHRKIFDEPMETADAVARVRAWVLRPHVVFLNPGARSIELAMDLLSRTGAAGNLTTDAQIAAQAIEANAEVHSNDSDFGRFEGLRWVNPLLAAKGR